MKWTVAWERTADDDLADIWVRASSADRREITQASVRIERELRTDPDRKGQRYYGDRLFQYGPLAVGYMLIPDDYLVKITQVMRIREK
jgi:hypothetical protein